MDPSDMQKNNGLSIEGIPDDYAKGSAVGGGDCFFDSVAQSMQDLIHTVNHSDINIDLLRKTCFDFATVNADSEYSKGTTWRQVIVEDAEKGGYLTTGNFIFERYLSQIKVSAQEQDRNSSPIWGRPEIEGRMLCQRYLIQLHVIEIQHVDNQLVVAHQLIRAEGSKSIDIDPALYEDNKTLHIFNAGNYHFVPILRKTLVEENITSLPYTLNQGKHSPVSLLETGILKNSDDKMSQSETENNFSKKRQINNRSFSSDSKKIKKKINESTDVTNNMTHLLKRNSGMNSMCVTPVKKSSDMVQDNDKYKASGVKLSLHGIAYQWKILMLLAKRCQEKGYAFRMATEMDAAEKFDDAVLVYKKLHSNTQHSIFLQAKHFELESETRRKICSKDLLTETNGPFSLQKYFISHKKVKKRQLGQNGNFVIFTNIDFDFEDDFIHQDIKKLGSLYFEPYKAKLNLLEFDKYKEKGELYQFVSENHPYRKTVADVLKLLVMETSEFKKIADSLAHHLIFGEKIKLEGVFKNYHAMLSTHIIDVHSKKFKTNFVKNQIPNLSIFHQTLLQAIEKCIDKLMKKPQERYTERDIKILKLCQTFNDTNLNTTPHHNKVNILNLELNISPGFQKKIIIDPSPKLSNPMNIAEVIVHLMNINKKEKNITISQKEKTKHKLLDLEFSKLAGHVLVKSKNKKVMFRSLFFDACVLPGNLNEFRDHLLVALKFTTNLELKHKLLGYTFKISKFQTCYENELDNLADAALGILKQPNDTEINDFLNDLIFAVKQPNEINLGNIIRQELGETFNLTDADFVSFDFQNKILDWFKKKEGEFLSENKIKNYFEEIDEKISQLKVIGLTSDYTKELHDYGVEFNTDDDYDKTLENFINASTINQSILNIIINSSQILLSCIKMRQHITKKPRGSYIFIRLNTFARLVDQVLQAFRKNDNNLLIIACEFDSEITDLQIMNKLHSTLRMQNICKGESSGTQNHGAQYKKKLILISTHDHPWVSQFNDKNEYQMYQDNIGFTHFSPNSQKKFLEKNVIFQGYLVKLKELVDPDSSVADALPLASMLTKSKLEIGGSLPISYGYDPKLYINRTFKLHITINVELFKDSTIKYIVTNDPQEFEQLCQKYPRENIHWLQQTSNQWVWKKTKGHLENLRKYINCDHTERYEENKLIQHSQQHNFMLISDTPGMGKSTVLTHLSKKIKEQTPSFWVAKINLNDHTEKFKLIQDKNVYFSSEAAINFIRNDLLNLKINSLHNFLFEHLLHKNKVVLMLDGFDEISPYYKSTVLELLQSLKQSPIQQVWVTTRPHLKEDLENQLQQFSYTLYKFRKEDQVEFITNFWKRLLLQKTEIDEEKIRNYANKLVGILEASIKDNEFTGIPLQTYMLAEAFDKEFEKFYYSSEFNLPAKLNLLALFDKFLDRKYLIYLADKRTPSTHDIATGELISILKGGVNLRKTFQQLAIKFLFAQQQGILLENLKSRDIQNDKLSRIGIANKNGKIDFVHRTFAEYFVADFLSERLKKENISDTFVKFLIHDIFLLNENQVIRSFLNNFLEGVCLSQHIYSRFGNVISVIHDSLLQPVKSREITLFNDPNLISLNYDIDLYNQQHFEPLQKNKLKPEHIVSTRGLHHSDKEKERNWRTDITRETGGTILHQAVQETNFNVVNLFLNSLQDKVHDNYVKKLLLYKDDLSETSWLGMVLKGNHDTLSKLWSIAKERLNMDSKELKELLLSENVDKQTSYHWAVKNGNLLVLEKLWMWARDVKLENLVFIQDKHERTVWTWAVQYGTIETLDFLWKSCGEESLIKKYLFSQFDDYGNVWYWAAQNDVKVFDYLLKKRTSMREQPYVNEELLPALFGAAENGNIVLFQKLTELLNKKDIFNKQNVRNATAWILASENSQINILSKLLELANCNKIDMKSLLFQKSRIGQTALHLACGHNYDNLFDFQWKLATDLNVLRELLLTNDTFGQTPWFISVWMGNKKYVEIIWEHSNEELRKTFLTNCRSDDMSVWYAAAQSNKIEVLKKLINLAEDQYLYLTRDKLTDILLLRKEYASLPSLWTAAVYKNNKEILDLLWKKCRELVGNESSDLKTPLLCLSTFEGSIWHKLFSLEHKKEMFNKLLEFCKDSNLSSDEFRKIWLAQHKNNTPLDVLFDTFRGAIERIYIIKELKNYNSKFHDETLAGEFLAELTYYALIVGNLIVTKTLLKKKPIYSYKKNGNTFLHAAVRSQNRKDMTELLLNNLKLTKEFINVANNDGDTPIMLAIKLCKDKNDLTQIIGFLVENGATIEATGGRDLLTPIHLAAKIGNLEATEILIEKGANVFVKNKCDTLLHRAISGNNIQLIQLIITTIKEKSINQEQVHQVLNAFDSNEYYTPLMWAIEKNNIKAVRVLLEEKDIYINIKNKDNYTAFTFATKITPNSEIEAMLVVETARRSYRKGAQSTASA